MGNLCFFVFVVFTYLINFVIFAEESYGNCYHDAGHSKKSLTPCSSNCTEAVVPAPTWSDSADFAQDLQNLHGVEESSFQRRNFPCQDRCNNDDQCTMALWGLPTTAQTLSRVLPYVNCPGKAPSTAPMSTIPELVKMGMPHGLKTPGETLRTPPHGAGPGPKAGLTRRRVAGDPRVRRIDNRTTTTAKGRQRILRPIHTLEKAKAKGRCHHCRHL